MIKIKFSKKEDLIPFENFTDAVSYLRSKAALWEPKDSPLALKVGDKCKKDSSISQDIEKANTYYKRQVLKRIKIFYGIVYINQVQTDEEFIRNLYNIGEVVDIIETD